MKTANALGLALLMALEPIQRSCAGTREQRKYKCIEKYFIEAKSFAFFLMVWQILFPGQF